MGHCEKCNKEVVPTDQTDVYRLPYTHKLMKLCSPCLTEMQELRGKRFIFTKGTNEGVTPKLYTN